MYIKEEIKITDEDKVIITKLGELLCLTTIDDYFYDGLEFFSQLKVFTDEFNEAYDKGFAKYFIHKNFYRWVTSNVINKFTALLQALFEGLLGQFNEDADGVLTYKNCKAYRTYTIVTQSEEQAETTHEVTSRILELEEAHLYENNMLEIQDNLIQVMPCFHIKVDQQEKVDAKVRKELVKELRVLVYKRMCSLLESNFKRANCVEVIQYRLMLAILICVIDKGFEPRFKSECYDSYEVARGINVSLKPEFNYFKATYAELRHYKKSLIRL